VRMQFQLLGPPLLRSNGRLVRLHSTKTLALLAYLVLEAEVPQSRETLATLFWGEKPEKQARHSLRQALFSIRQKLSGLAETCLQLIDNSVTYCPQPDFWVDLSEFQKYAGSQELNDLQQAANLYRGVLLEGLILDDCPDFGEWLFFRRDALEQQAFDVIKRLSNGLFQGGDYRQAQTYARRLMEMNPLDESAHRLLMRIHAALGDFSGVRQQYQLCVEILAREIGVEPAGETSSTFRHLTTAQAIAPQQVGTYTPKMASSFSPNLPFQNRHHELAALQDQLSRAVDGMGSVIFLAGEAGIGKTSLISEFLRLNLDKLSDSFIPFNVLAGRCFPLESSAPYAMWAEALSPLANPKWSVLLEGLSDIWRQQIHRLVPDIKASTTESEGISSEENHLRLLQGILKVLIYLSRATPLILYFDDIHWADQPSLTLLHYVIRQMSGYSLMLLCTYRTEAVVDQPHLEQLLQQITHYSHVYKLDLEPLDQEVVDQLLAQAELNLPHSFIHRLHHHSEGNPFVLVETLRALFEAGILHHTSRKQIVGFEQINLPLPQKVQEIIWSRVMRLEENNRQVLATAAVIGFPFEFRLLKEIYDGAENELLEILEQLINRGFLAEISSSSSKVVLDFSHEFIRHSIYKKLSAMQRQSIHRRVATALLAMNDAEIERLVEDIAYHFEKASEMQAIRYLIQSAENAEKLFAYVHAADLYTRALALHHQYLPDDLVAEFKLILAREALLDRQGQRGRQAKDIASLLALAEKIGDTSLKSQALVREAGYLAYTGQFEQARQVCEMALDLYRAAQNLNGEAQALRELGFIHWKQNDFRAALEYNRSALDLHRRLGDIAGEASATHNLAEIHRGLGSARQALAMYESALNLYWAQGDQRAQVLTLYGMAHALYQLGQHQAALEAYQRSLDLTQTIGDRLMESRIYHTLANLYWASRDHQQAIESIQQAIQVSEETGYGPGIAHGLLTLSYFYAQRNDTEACRKQLNEALTWLQLIEDHQSLANTQSQLLALEEGDLSQISLPETTYWFKSHVILAEGKVYCEFESPVRSVYKSPPSEQNE
jgi:predicted ATPase/DNA-binding SARP family transcriptional activator